MGRRPIPEHLKKKSSEYPQIAFRVSEKDKDRILGLIESTANALNKTRKEKDPYWTKGDVFVKALLLGIESLRKK